LNPEWAVKSELTVSRQFFKALDLTVAGFLNRVHDMIYRSGQLGIYHNIDRATLQGIEVNGRLGFDRADIFSGLTLLDATDGDGEKLDYRPSWKLDNHLDLRLTSRLNLTLHARAVGKRRTEMKTDLDPYHVENIGVSYSFEKLGAISLGLKNIFDVNFEEELGYPMAGRTVWLGIDGHFAGK